MLTCEGDPARRLPVGLPELALLELLPGSPATAGRTSALAAAGRKLVRCSACSSRAPFRITCRTDTLPRAPGRFCPCNPSTRLGSSGQCSCNDSGCAIRLTQVRGPARAALAERPMRQTYSECNPTCPYLLPALARTVLRRDRGELQRRWRTTAATGQRSRSACRGSAGLGERVHRSGHMARAPASGDNRGSVHFSPGGVAIPIPRDSTRARPRIPQEPRAERGRPPGQRPGGPATAGLCGDTRSGIHRTCDGSVAPQGTG
jgi:hypothetical protein